MDFDFFYTWDGSVDCEINYDYNWKMTRGEYEYYISGGVSIYEAAAVVASETFSTTLSAISFFSSPTNDMETVDMEIENNGN